MNNKNRLLDIFSKIEQDVTPLNQHYNSKVLVIDGINTFIRSFAAVNHLNSYGNHVGGLTGFLKSVGSAIRQIQPTRCIIVFDGEAGSTNRKYLYPDYKSNRTKTKMLNYKSFNNKKEEESAQYDEIVRLMDYLEFLPVVSISIDKLEADDVIGYITTTIHKNYDDSQVYIMSTDNDFIQLVNDRVFVYSPIKKITYNEPAVLKEFNVHPQNFLLYKTMIGDTSDNIPGVDGLGEKNTPKLFEILSESNRKNLEDIYDICKDPPKKSVLYQRILEVSSTIEIFYKIMNLREPNISDEDVESIMKLLYSKPPNLQKYSFQQLLRKDRISDATLCGNNWIDLFGALNNF